MGGVEGVGVLVCCVVEVCVCVDGCGWMGVDGCGWVWMSVGVCSVV